MPSVLYIVMRHGSDPEEAIVRAVNDTKDNDTIGAVVGCLVGALHGRSALPERLIERLSGRTAEHDDGRVFEILEGTRRPWYPGGPAARPGVGCRSVSEGDGIAIRGFRVGDYPPAIQLEA